MRLKSFLINEFGSGGKSRAEFLETCALLGVNPTSKFMSLCRDIVGLDSSRKTQDNIRYLVDDFMMELNGQFTGGMDWNSVGMKAVKEVVKEDTKNIATICHLAVGMNNYINSVVKMNTKYFIHGKIKEYYFAEKQSLGIMKGSKDNTTDCVICSAPAETVIKALTMSKPEPDAEGGFYTLGNIKCYQVSLKKSEADAQLGKVAGYINTGLKLGQSAMKTAEKIVGLTNEDWSIKGMATTLWDKVTMMIDNVLLGFKGLFSSTFKRGVTKGDLDDIAKAIDYNGVITESMVEYYNQPSLNEAFGKDDPRVGTFTEAIQQRGDKVLQLINRNLREAEKADAVKDDVASLIVYLSNIKETLTPVQAHDIVANYSISQTILEFLTKIKDVGTTVRQITAEMFFGGTKLPLWKVYGAYGKEKCWVYLGTIESFISKQQPSNVEVFGFKAIPHGSKHSYDMMIVMLDKITAEGKSYFLFRADNNQGIHTFAANIEGNKAITVSLDTNLTDVLKKYKL